jgi:diguanylate cyclase (GGDEF)-like protein
MIDMIIDRMKNKPLWFIIFIIWFISSTMSVGITNLIISLTISRSYLLSNFIALSASTIISLLTSIPLVYFYSKVITMKNEIIDLSKFDNLTGLMNRASFIESYEQLIIDANLHHFSITVILFDLDHFKFVNDTFGHVAGDKVLIEVGKITSSLAQEEDLTGRFGGEEFIFVTKNKTKEEAKNIANKIRKNLDHLIQYENETIKFTVSVGAIHCEQCNLTSNELIKIADDNLYNAKENGRNRVSMCVI